MLCQRCKKNSANVHIVKLVNGEKNELWVCEQCAKELSDISINMIDGKDVAGQFQDMMGAFLQAVNKEGAKMPAPEKVKSLKDEYNIEIVCKKCGLTYSEYKKTGRFGCEECYNNFIDIVKNDINKDDKEHIGKIPVTIEDEFKVKRKINSLRKILKEHVKNEEYEKAAEIRDQIKEIENILDKEISYEELDR